MEKAADYEEEGKLVKKTFRLLSVKLLMHHER